MVIVVVLVSLSTIIFSKSQRRIEVQLIARAPVEIAKMKRDASSEMFLSAGEIQEMMRSTSVVMRGSIPVPSFTTPLVVRNLLKF